MSFNIRQVSPSSAEHTALVAVADALGQAKYIVKDYPHSERSILFGAFQDSECIGFLLLLIQVIGSEEQRSPIVVSGKALLEGYVEAFGVAPNYRRQGIGQRLQERAIAACESERCYQMRSRSPVTSLENYRLKLKMGFSIHPGSENDSYYFARTLRYQDD